MEDNEYIIPEAYDHDGGVNQVKRFSAAARRYNDFAAGEKMNPFAEQEAWEESQFGKANIKFGSKNRKQEADEFEYVFDDGVDFIKASVTEGIHDEDEKYEDFCGQSVLKKIQEEKKTLPICHYQEELLKAIRDYQVIIIVGETGSGKTTQIPQYLHKAGYTKRGKVRSMKRAGDIRDQLEGLLKRSDIEMTSNANDLDAVKKAITAGYFLHVARLHKGGEYRTVKNSQTVHIHPSSGPAKLPRWVIFHELVLTTKRYIRQEEIEIIDEIIKRRTKGLGTKVVELIICPLYANLPTELLGNVFKPIPGGVRKAVLSTNIAVTSLKWD